MQDSHTAASTAQTTPEASPLRLVPTATMGRQRWTSLFLVTPQTLLRWHRELVRRKWSYRNRR